jgi:hypothetical protein
MEKNYKVVKENIIEWKLKIKCRKNKIRTQRILCGSVYDLSPQDKSKRATLCFHSLIFSQYIRLLSIREFE